MENVGNTNDEDLFCDGVVKSRQEHTSTNCQPSELRTSVQGELDFQFLTEKYNSGKFDECLKYASKHSHPSSDTHTLLNLLGCCHSSMNRFDEAILFFDRALEKGATDENIYFNKANALAGNNQLEAAVQEYLKVLKISPSHSETYINLGSVLRSLGHLSSSTECYQAAIEFSDGNAKAHYNLANNLMDEAQFEPAIDNYLKAIQYDPDFFEAYKNICVAYSKTGAVSKLLSMLNTITNKFDYSGHSSIWRGEMYLLVNQFDKAYDLLSAVVNHEPDNHEALYILASALNGMGKHHEALKYARRAQLLCKEVTKYQFLFGEILIKLQFFQQGEEVINTILSQDPEHIQSWIALAELYEKTNKLIKLRNLLTSASEMMSGLPHQLMVYDVILKFRSDKYQEAYDVVGRIEEDRLTSDLKLRFLQYFGKLLDKLERYDDAGSAYLRFSEAKKCHPSFDQKVCDEYFLDLQHRNTSYCKKRTQHKPTHNYNQIRPVFLIGFPRSGTTLLDTILRSHSKLNVLEELPMVEAMKKVIQAEGTFDFIHSFPDDDLCEFAAKTYIDLQSKQIKASYNKKDIVIDKLPMNLVDVPLIQHIFPKSKFILAIRHPLDAIFSNWTQNYKLNPAMMNMVDLDRAFDFYVESMKIYDSSEKLLNLQVHKIRYEDVVTNMKTEVTKLLKFLKLDWEDGLMNYAETAKNRKRISTPSYSQVIQPIYKSSTYKWQNYQDLLSENAERVRPWVEKYGYTF